MACGGCEAAKRRREAAAAKKSGGSGTAKTVEQIKADQAKIPTANQMNTTGTTQQFSLQMRDGRTFRFGSRLEAEAENVRLGYTGTVKPS